MAFLCSFCKPFILSFSLNIDLLITNLSFSQYSEVYRKLAPRSDYELLTHYFSHQERRGSMGLSYENTVPAVRKLLLLEINMAQKTYETILFKKNDTTSCSPKTI